MTQDCAYLLFPQLSGTLKKKPFRVQFSMADLLPNANTTKAVEVLLGRRK